VDLLEALLLAACFAVIEILVSSFQIPHFEVTIESLIHVLIRNDPRKENRIFIRCFILKTHSIFLQSDGSGTSQASQATQPEQSQVVVLTQEVEYLNYRDQVHHDVTDGGYDQDHIPE